MDRKGEEFSVEKSMVDAYGRPISKAAQPTDPSSQLNPHPIDCPPKEDIPQNDAYLCNPYFDFPDPIIASPGSYPEGSTIPNLDLDYNLAVPPSAFPQTHSPESTGSLVLPTPADCSTAESDSSSTPLYSYLSPILGSGLSPGPGPQIKTVQSTQLEKRRAQNRASQRAFRERQESYTSHLEQELIQLQAKYDALLRCIYELKSVYTAIEGICGTELTGPQWEPGSTTASHTTEGVVVI